MKRRRAFTLIELLIVVAIIAILAAMLFPVFARAREKARETACASNLMQIGKALSMYQQDFDERMCPTRIWGDGGINAPYPLWRTGVWDFLIQPYARDWAIMKCPSMDPADPLLPDRPLTYGMNYRLGQFNIDILNDAPHLYFNTINSSQIRSPANTIWVTDTAWVNNPTVTPIHSEDPRLWSLNLTAWNNEGFVRFPQNPPSNTVSGQSYGPAPGLYITNPWRPAPIHNAGTNVLFVDGHVKRLTTDKLVNPPRGHIECLYDNGHQ
jgi:prepilin-type N-terminal cleavage/methylation domain-containing protein/prepilin-type processing-associated H-X9-DG protein